MFHFVLQKEGSILLSFSNSEECQSFIVCGSLRWKHIIPLLGGLAIREANLTWKGLKNNKKVKK
jgi:hypothetical protein